MASFRMIASKQKQTDCHGLSGLAMTGEGGTKYNPLPAYKKKKASFEAFFGVD